MLGAVDVVRVAAQSLLFIIITRIHTQRWQRAQIPLEEKKLFALPWDFIYCFIFFPHFLKLRRNWTPKKQDECRSLDIVLVALPF
jgi:hypothetical protein